MAEGNPASGGEGAKGGGNTDPAPQPKGDDFKQKYEATSARATQLENEFNEFKKKFEGVDPEDYRNTKKKLGEILESGADNSAEGRKAWEEHKEAELRQAYGKQLDTANSRAEKAENALKELRVVKTGSEVAQKIGFLPEVLDIVEAHVRANCEWDESRGQVIVRGQDGKPLTSKTDPRALMTLEEFLEDYGNSKPVLLRPKQETGTVNANDPARVTHGRGSQTQFPSNWDSMDQNQRTQWFRQNPKALASYRGRPTA